MLYIALVWLETFVLRAKSGAMKTEKVNKIHKAQEIPEIYKNPLHTVKKSEQLLQREDYQLSCGLSCFQCMH